jgi:hypothetical protein
VSAPAVVVAVMFAIWLFVTVVSQFERAKIFKLLDPFALIPLWTFFAPNPGTTDYHLLYRDIWRDGQVGHWKEVRLHTGRGLISTLWNPQKRRSKAFFDLVMALVQEAQRQPEEPRLLTISTPYILLINAVNSLPHTRFSTATQFLILQSHGYHAAQEPEVAVVSGVHQLC